MEKVKLAPVDFESNLQEFTKEELKEAGIVIDYIDEEYKTNKNFKRDDEKKKKWKRKHYLRWILLSILILFVVIIFRMGTTYMSNEAVEKNSNQTLSSVYYDVAFIKESEHYL